MIFWFKMRSLLSMRDVWIIFGHFYRAYRYLHYSRSFPMWNETTIIHDMLVWLFWRFTLIAIDDFYYSLCRVFLFMKSPRSVMTVLGCFKDLPWLLLYSLLSRDFLSNEVTSIDEVHLVDTGVSVVQAMQSALLEVVGSEHITFDTDSDEEGSHHSLEPFQSLPSSRHRDSEWRSLLGQPASFHMSGGEF